MLIKPKKLNLLIVTRCFPSDYFKLSEVVGICYPNFSYREMVVKSRCSSNLGLVSLLHCEIIVALISGMSAGSSFLTFFLECGSCTAYLYFLLCFIMQMSVLFLLYLKEGKMVLLFLVYHPFRGDVVGSRLVKLMSRSKRKM